MIQKLRAAQASNALDALDGLGPHAQCILGVTCPWSQLLVGALVEAREALFGYKP
jgi:hypothetical protein